MDNRYRFKSFDLRVPRVSRFSRPGGFQHELSLKGVSMARLKPLFSKYDLLSSA